jgi:translocation and assembly module TamB
VGHLAELVQDTLDARGWLTLHARIEGTRSAPRMQATMALDSGGLGGTSLPGIEASLDWAEDVLAVDGVLTGTRPETGGPPVTLADVTGTVALALPWDSLAGPRTLDGTLRVDSLPLESVPTLSAAAADMRGVVRGQVDIGGTLESPDLDGTLAIAGGGVDLIGPGVRLADVTGVLRMDGSTLFVDSLTAVSGGGSLLAAGSVELEGDDGPVADLTVRARRALIANFDLAEGVRADADLRVVGPLTALAVTGTARIREGIFYAHIEQSPALDLEGYEAEDAIAAAEVIDAVVPARGPLSGLRADVAVRVDRNTWIRALDGTAEIYTPEDGAPLSVRYDPSRDLPALDGVVHADRGEWAFAGRRFELTTGTATFLRASELDPLLQLTAVHEVVQPGRDPLEILITVGGRLQAPVVTLTSDAQPPLPQTDLLSYLVFGTSSGSLMQVGGSGLMGGGAAQVGALAAQQLASVVVGTLFEEALADIEARSGRYGLDVLRITAAELPEELAFDAYFQNVLRGTQIEAGKYVTPRLFVAARGRTTTEALPGLRTEYRTQHGFRWTAAWEPRYLPLLPEFGTGRTAEQTRALSTFLFWKWRY